MCRASLKKTGLQSLQVAKAILEKRGQFFATFPSTHSQSAVAHEESTSRFTKSPTSIAGRDR